jgi:pimeloyl-ACP methyl ester carboxylesterase
LALSLSAAAQVSQQQFEGWLSDAQKEPLTGLPAQLADQGAQAKQTHYVFVQGFLGELIHSAFRDNMAALRTVGVADDHIHEVKISSLNPIPANVELFSSRLSSILSADNDPIVLIGHSEGATVVLAYALGASEAIRHRLGGVYLVHGCFGGSPIADFLSGNGVPIDSRLPVAVRWVMEGIESLDIADRIAGFEKATGMHFGAGAVSLTHAAETAFWQGFLADHQTELQEVNSRVYYLRGYQTPQNVPYAMYVPDWYMDVYYGQNDGLVPLDYQLLDGVGSTLAVLQEDHNFAVGTSPNTKAAIAQRTAITGALFMTAATDLAER